MTTVEFGRAIRLRREELGMSQEELAHKIGYKSKVAVTKIEKGQRDLPRSKIVDIAEALHTTPAVLLGWEDAEGRDAVRKELHDLIDHLPADRLEKILHILQAVEE